MESDSGDSSMQLLTAQQPLHCIHLNRKHDYQTRPAQPTNHSIVTTALQFFKPYPLSRSSSPNQTQVLCNEINWYKPAIQQ